MRAKKRFLSLLLCGAMLFSLCPQAAFAEGGSAGGLCEHHPQHTAECGYTEGGHGTPCTYVCEICTLRDSGEVEETEPEAECICTGLCTEETMNAECPVCGAEDADLTACEGVEEETATASNAPMPLLPTTALAAGEEPSVTLIITSSGGSAVYGTTVSMVATVTNLTSSSQVFVQLFKGTDAQYFAQQPATPMPDTGMLSVTYEVSLTGDTWEPADYNITAKVNINGTTYSSEAVNLKVTKANQSLSAPTASEVTSNSVTLNAVTGQGEVKYAYVEGENQSAPTEDSKWQADTTFSNLKPATAYTFFARCAGNDYYNEATTSAVIYTNYAAPTDLNFTDSGPGKAVANWDSVAENANYTLQLYKGEQAVGNAVTTSITSHEFTINEVGTYHFTVKAAIGETDGDVATSKNLTFYEVKFDSMGGSNVPSQFVVKDNRADQPTPPTKDGYAFGGWYKDKNFNNKWSFDVAGGDSVSTSDVTLYAKWTPCTYAVTLHPNGGTINTGNVTAYTYGTSTPLPTDVTRDGYTFEGWYASEALTGDPVTAISTADTGDKAYWAKWTENAPPYVPPTPVAPPEIDFTPGGGQPTSVELEPGQSATLDLGVVDNYAAFAAAGVEIVATPVCDAGMTASAVVDQSGRILLNLYAIEPGEHQVSVTLSAAGCQPVTVAQITLTVPEAQPEDPEDPDAPDLPDIQPQEGTQAYTGVQGVTHLSLSQGTVVFTLPDLAGTEGVVWKSSKPKVVSIDPQTGEAQLKKSGTATLTATLPDGTTITQKVNVHKKDFAQPDTIRLQTKVDGKWTDVPEEGIVVVPKKSGQKSVPTRLVGDGGEIIIESIEADKALLTRSSGNPAPVKIKKRSLTDGQTTTLIIKANGQEFTLPITIDSTAKDLYPDPLPSEIQSILQQEEP